MLKITTILFLCLVSNIPNVFGEVSQETLFKVDNSILFVVTPKYSGTAFIINENSQAITCFHVVEYSSGTIDIYDTYRQKYSAKIIQFSKEKDIAVLQIKRLNTEDKALKFREPSSIRIGEDSFVISNPLPHLFTVSEGIVSAIRNELFFEKIKVIQTDTAIWSGSSGSPLMDKNGNVIGMIFLAFASHYSGIVTNEGLNYAINSEEILNFLTSKHIEFSMNK